jgi:enamine deaminase RidA (YjgF/YER057c/UK114 family)
MKHFYTKNNLFKKNFSFKNKMDQNKIKFQPIDSSKTPKALGPYSKATRVDMGDKYMIFLSGSLGLDHTTGNLVSDDVSDQAKQALENMKNLLE